MPHRMLSLILLAGCAHAPEPARRPPPGMQQLERWPEPALRPGLGEPQIAAAITDYARTLNAGGYFSGVVLAAHGDRVVVSAAYGQADAATPNTVDTAFNIGSLDKLFTRTAIAQLADAGKLRLEDTVRMRLPELALPGADKITLQQLLDHRSGLGDIFGPRYDAAPPARLRELADFVPLFVDQPLAFEPGTDERYSNAGFIVLGLIIERVTGGTYRDYVAAHIFAPAQMAHTGPWELEAHPTDRATGYMHGVPNTPTLSGRSSSAGGSFSTAGDLLRFWQALRAGTLLSPAWTRWMLGPHPRLGVGGGGPGLNASIEIADGWTVIALANLDPPAAMGMARGAMDIIRGRRARGPRARSG